MSRGPGRIEHAIEVALRDADRSFSTDELVRVAYRGIANVEKKHRVAVLRALDNVANRMLLWTFTAGKPGGQYFTTNGYNVRSYAHGLMRGSWWNQERSLAQIDEILSHPEIQKVMEPGGLWWVDVEVNKANYELSKSSDDAAKEELRQQIDMLNQYRDGLFGDGRCPHKHGRALLVLLGRFEPPGSPVFEYAMKLRHEYPLAIPLPY